MSEKVLQELEETDVTLDTEYQLVAGASYVFACNGNGVWEHQDEDGSYVSYAVGSVDGKNFVGVTPPSGKVQFNVTSGTCTISFKKV